MRDVAAGCPDHLFVEKLQPRLVSDACTCLTLPFDASPEDLSKVVVEFFSRIDVTRWLITLQKYFGLLKRETIGIDLLFDYQSVQINFQKRMNYVI